MKIALIVLCFCTILPPTAFSQRNHVAKIRLAFWDWQQNGNEMEGPLYGDLYFVDQFGQETFLQTSENPQPGYTFYFENDEGSPGQYHEYYRPGPRHGVVTANGYNVRVTISGPGIQTQPSPPLNTWTPDSSERHAVLLHGTVGIEGQPQSPATGVKIERFGDKEVVQAAGTIWNNVWFHGVGEYPSDWHFTTSHNKALRSIPDYVSAFGSKFQRWDDDEGSRYYLNHEIFSMGSQIDAITVRYRPVADGVTIATGLIENPGLNSNVVQLLDPWLRDYEDGLYGIRNQGLSAPPKDVSYGINNLGISTAYKGVFLNQTVNQGIYYSVRAPLVQTINGSAAFFTGWSYDTNYVKLEQVGSNPSGYDQKAVIFKQAGATVTAQYTNSSITQNTTIPAGTHQMAGSLTVSSGVTLTLSPGATLEFPSGATLTLNGKLIANGTSGQKITLTRRSGSFDWMGFSLAGSGANASSLQHCIITYAKQPIVATNVGSMTINGMTVDHSSFYNNNSNDAAALRFYNSSPTITYLTVNGQSDSWNGVRFAGGSNGSITLSTIQNCGAGNGIVVQGGSAPLIRENTVQGNHYHGIIVVGNGSGNPVVIGNSVLNNGVVNGVKTYVGINFYNSTGKIGSNTTQGSNYGYYFDTYASPTTWWTGAWWGEVGNNTVSGNLHGIVAYNNSNPVFGRVNSFHGEPEYFGACNNILNNTTSNAYASLNCYVEAAGNWWGQAPPDPAKIQYYSGSFIASGYYGTPSQPCPGGGGGATANPIGSPEIVSSGSVTEETQDPVSARLLGDFARAREAYVAMLGDESLDQAKRSRALVGLYEVLRDSKDPLILQSLVSSKTNPEFVTLAEELIMNSHVILGNYADAEELAQAASQSSDKEKRNNALLLLASLDSYSTEYSNVSQTAKEQLKASGVNEGMLVALGIEPIGKLEESGSSSGPGGTITLSNYPNPFNPSTNINFTIPEEGHVTIRVFDMLGRVVESLLNETRSAGSHQVSFDGSWLPSGVYFYRLDFNGQALSRKFVLAK